MNPYRVASENPRLKEEEREVQQFVRLLGKDFLVLECRVICALAALGWFLSGMAR